jgi:hypothetical protein
LGGPLRRRQPATILGTRVGFDVRGKTIDHLSTLADLANAWVDFFLRRHGL